MSDVPLVGPAVRDVTTSFVVIDALLGPTGAYVLQVKVETDPGCWIRTVGQCEPRLHVVGRVWSGLG